jgi:hypothetical protein
MPVVAVMVRPLSTMAHVSLKRHLLRCLSLSFFFF